ncbi:MAG: recombinase family protein [Clostridia bacterium]
MIKAAAYARYSSDNQREESIEAQLRAIREYCDRNGIRLVKIYTDEARSATTDDRPGFLQMIQDSALGLFAAVIVHISWTGSAEIGMIPHFISVS